MRRIGMNCETQLTLERSLLEHGESETCTSRTIYLVPY